MDNKIVDNNTVNTIVDKLKHTRLLAGIGLMAMFLGTILPYIKTYSILGVSIKLSLWRYWEGKIILILLIANAIFLFKDYVEKYIPSILNVPIWRKISELKYQYAMAPAIIALAVVLYLTIHANVGFAMFSTGFYTLWFCVICIIIYLIINKGKPVIPTKDIRNQNQTYNDFQNTNTNYNVNQNNQINNNISQNHNNGTNNTSISYGANQNGNIKYNQNNYNTVQNNYNPNVNNNVNNYNPNTNNNNNM